MKVHLSTVICKHVARNKRAIPARADGNSWIAKAIKQWLDGNAQKDTPFNRPHGRHNKLVVLELPDQLRSDLEAECRRRRKRPEKECRVLRRIVESAMYEYSS